MNVTRMEAAELLRLDGSALQDRLQRICDRRLDEIEQLMRQCRDATASGRTLFRITHDTPKGHRLTVDAFDRVITAVVNENNRRCWV